MAQGYSIGLKLRLDTTKAELDKQIIEVEKKISRKINIGVNLNINKKDIEEELSKFKGKSMGNIGLNIKLNTKVGYIYDQIRELNGKIKKEIVLKLKLDASSVTVEAEKARKKAEQSMKNSSGGSASTNTITSTIFNPATFLNADEAKIRASATSALKAAGAELSKIQVSMGNGGVNDINKVILTYNNNLGKTVTETMKLRTTTDAATGAIVKSFETTGVVTKTTRSELEKVVAIKEKLNAKMSTLSSKDYGMGKLDPAHLASINESIGKVGNGAESVSRQVSKIKDEFRLADENAKKLNATMVQEARKTDRKEIFKASGSDTLKYQGIGSSAMKDSISQYMSSKLPNVQYQVQELGLLEKRLAGVTGAMNRMVVSYKTAEGETKTFQVQADRLAGTMIRLEGATKAAGKDMSFFGQLKSAAAGFPIWMIAATAWMQTINAMREGIKYVVEMDDAMVELGKVTDFTSQQMEGLRQSAVKTGAELGQSTSGIMKSYAEIARVHKDTKDIEELGRVAALSSNVTSMTAEQASKAINTTMITFKLGVKDAMGILDQWNSIQNTNRVSAEDLAASIGKVGAAARQAGFSIQELEGFTAAVVGATGISGDEFGTAFKSMSSRIFRIGPEGEEDAGKAEETLNKLGIAVRKNNGEFRKGIDILKDVNAVWGTWGNITQNNVAQVVGGTHHYSKFISMMENFDKATEVTNIALNSQGSALNENAKRMDSISGKMGILKASAEKVWSTLLKSGELKAFIDLLIMAVRLVGNFNTILMVTATIIGFWKGTAILKFFSSLPAMIRASTTAMALFNEVSLILSLRQSGLLTMTQALSGGFSALGKSVMAVFTTNPIGWVALAITAFMMLDNYLEQKEADRQAEFTEKIRKSEEDISKLDDASSYYKKNFENINKDAEVKKNLLEMQTKLNTAFGIEAKGIDLVNGKYSEQIEKLDKLSKKKREDVIKELEIKTAPSLEKTYVRPKIAEESGLSGVAGFAKDYKVESNMFGNVLGLVDFDKIAYNKSLMNAKEYYEELDKLKSKIANKSMTEKDSLTGKLPKTSQEWANALASVDKELERIKPKADEIAQLEARRKDNIVANTMAQSQFNEKQKGLFDIAFTKVKYIDDKQYQEEATKIVSIIRTSGEDIKKLSEGFGKIEGIDADTISKELKTFSDSSYIAAKSAEELEKQIKETDQSFHESVDGLQMLRDAQEELSSGHKLSAKTIEALMDKYPDLLAFQDDELKMSQMLKLSEEEQIKLVKANFEAKLETNVKWLGSLKDNGAILVDTLKLAYGKDLDNFTTVAQLKLQTTSFLLEKIGGAWASIYGTEEAGLTALLKPRSAYGGTETYLNSSMSKEDKAKAQAQLDTLEAIRIAREKLEKGIDFGTLASGADKKGSDKDAKKKNAENYKNDIDDLFALNRALDVVNQKIAENQANQELSTTYDERINLMMVEITLLKEKAKAINDLTYSEGELAKEKRKKLADEYKLTKFDSSGGYDVAQYESIRSGMIATINAHKDDEDAKIKNDAENRLKSFEDLAKSMLDMEKKYQEDKTKLTNSYGEVNKAWAKTRETQATELMRKQSVEREDLLKKQAKLETEYSNMEEDSYQSRLDNLEQQNNVSDELIAKKEQQIKDLGTAWNLYDGSPEAQQKVHEQADALRKEIEDALQKQSANVKLTVDLNVKQAFSRSDMFSKTYKDDMENLDLEGRSLDSSDSEGYVNNKAKIISRVREEIKLQTLELARLNDIEKSGVGVDTEFIDKKKEVAKNLQELRLKETEYHNDYIEEIRSYAEKVIANEKKLAEDKVKVEEDKLNASKRAFDNDMHYKQKAYDDEQRAKEAYFYEAEKSLSEEERNRTKNVSGAEKSIALNNIQRQIRDYNAQMMQINGTIITQYDAQLSAMQAMSEVKRADIELIQKQLDLEKEKLTLANLENERTIKVLKKDSEGKYSWKMEADQAKIREQNERVGDAELNMVKYTEDEKFNTKRTALEDEKRVFDDLQHYKKEALDKAVRDFEENQYKERFALETTRIGIQKQYEDMDKNVTKLLEGLLVKYKGNLDGMLTELKSKAAEFDALNARIMQGAFSGQSAPKPAVAGTGMTPSQAASSGFSYAGPSQVSVTAGFASSASSGGISGKSSSVAMSRLGLDTGGYTGEDVPESGATAVLHKKELVLNASDTSNMLKLVDITRGLARNGGISGLALGGNSSSNSSNSETYVFNDTVVQSNDISGFINSMKRKVRSS